MIEEAKLIKKINKEIDDLIEMSNDDTTVDIEYAIAFLEELLSQIEKLSIKKSVGNLNVLGAEYALYEI